MAIVSEKRGEKRGDREKQGRVREQGERERERERERCNVIEKRERGDIFK